jgi:nitrate reductase NapE
VLSQKAPQLGTGFAWVRRPIFAEVAMKTPLRSPGSGSAASPVHPDDPNAPSTHQEEWRSFLFLTVVTAPVLAVVTVAGWGFVVWMYQLLSGRLPGYTS